jgi:hypothetical protein
MVVRIKIDASDLSRVADHVDHVSRNINQSITPHVNKAGEGMVKEIASEVSHVLSERISETLRNLPTFEEKFFSSLNPRKIMEAIVPRPGIGESDSEFEAEIQQFTYFRWVAADDACEICASLNGTILTAEMAEEMYPAHQNCRCELEPVDQSSVVNLFAEKQVTQASEEVVTNTLLDFLRWWS